jgi:NhaP-type Na+/H+ or K+/H+ antiporter
MNALFDFLQAFLFAGAVGGAFGYLGFVFIQKARSQGRSTAPVEEEAFVNVALCETRNGIKTHYHEIGFEALNFGGYPIEGHPTLCGAETGWDMENQDSEASCETCREALAKMAKEAA